MRIVLDCETDSKHSKIWIVVTKNLDTGEMIVWNSPKGLREFLDKCTLIVMQNGVSFDAPLLNRLWQTRIRLSQTFDTLVLSRLLDPSRSEGHSLEAWGKTLGSHKADYLGIWKWLMQPEEYVKGMEWDQPHMPLLIDYCKQDVEVTEQLYQYLLGLQLKHEFSNESVELEHKVAAIIAQQERSGYKLDVPHTISLVTTLKKRVDQLLERSQELYPPRTVERYSEKTGKRLKDAVVTFNMGSRQQIAEKLMEFGWKPGKHTEKGSIIVDEAVLDEIIKECT